jgi:hypothetical protein
MSGARGGHGCNGESFWEKRASVEMAMRARVMDMLLEVGAPLSGRFFQHNFYGYIFKEFDGIIDFFEVCQSL